MKRIGMTISKFEPFILDVSEGILVGGLLGAIVGVIFGTLLWSFTWQMLPTVYALPDILFATQLGVWDGILFGAFIALCWRLKLFLDNK